MRRSKLSRDELYKRCKEVFDTTDFGDGVEHLEVLKDNKVQVGYRYLNGIAYRYGTKILNTHKYLSERE